MLSIFNHHSRRRAMMQVGSVGALSLAGQLAMRSAAAKDAGSILKDRSVIFLFLHGGPSQIETFDPKMTAPSEIRSVTGEVKTKTPGLTFGGSFPQLAQHSDKLSIVRSFTTGNGNHDIKPVVSSSSLKASVGSVYSRVAGSSNPVNGMPNNVMLFPRAVDPDRLPGIMKFGKFNSSGDFGSVHQPFMPGSGGPLQDNMKLTLDTKRLDYRRQLLTGLDDLKRNFDSLESLQGVNRFRQQAFDTILGGAADAFDLTKESPETIRRYDTAPLIDPQNIRKVWTNHKRYIDNVKTLGKLLLLSRRLVERGCGFVTVTTNFVWDMHADVNNATMHEGMSYMGPPLDHALSAFIEDVESRGLQDKILLVCCGEMGRTPRINARGGRDHWGGLAPLMFYGGGTSRGAVIGQSTRDAGLPNSKPWQIPNLLATIFESVLDVGQLRLRQDIPFDVMRIITGHQPIDGVIA